MLEPKAEAVALPAQHLDPIAVSIQENKEHGVKHRDFDIQFDQRSQAIDGLSKVHRFWVEVHFFNGGIGPHHGDELLIKIGSTASAVSYLLEMWGLWSGRYDGCAVAALGRCPACRSDRVTGRASGRNARTNARS